MATTVRAKNSRELLGKGEGTSIETRVSHLKDGSLEMVKMDVKISEKN